MSLLNLPSEILTLVLLPLDLRSLISCSETSRHVKAVIDGSPLLQYRLASQIACVEYIPPENTHVTSSDRISALAKLQNGFEELRPSSTHTVQMDNCPIMHSYGLAGGIFAMTEPARKAFRTLSLASIDIQPPAWERLELSEYIYDFGLDPEQDLLVIISSVLHPDNPPPPDTGFNLRFYRLSTLSPHEEAPALIMLPSTSIVDWIDFEVDCCEDKVAVTVFFLHGSVDHLLVYDWKTGELCLDLTDDDSYSACTFLSRDVLLLGKRSGTLDLWAFGRSPDYVCEREVSLLLPPLPPGLLYFPMRLEYSPKGQCYKGQQSRKFRASYAESVVALRITCEMEEDRSLSKDWIVILSRKTLLQHLQSPENRGVHLLWEQWGPSTSRWLPCDSDASGRIWPTVICGQRLIILRHGGFIQLLDFNQYRWRKSLANGNATDRQDEDADEDQDGLGDVRLGYISKISQQSVDWKGVMLDDEWIVGINDTTDTDGKFSLEIWRFG
ncbi:F-box domain-containing protein [Favolaschia claudopus]|uniref:F-box domain-containing protein n=1 Tax=Favolaschia claudopus TaxID=2862362 RepID=A0AAW0C841_9AGAR